MSHGQRIVAGMLCVLCLLGLTSAAASQDGIYFVAVENTVSPLLEETMPFWHNDYLYISGDVFTGNARNASGISRAKIGDSLLIYRGEQSLLFRKDYPYAQDPEENSYSPGMVWRDGNGYVPAAVIADYFNLLYSTTEVEHGKLVWLRSASFTMNERAFAKAAAFQLNTAYEEYVKTLDPAPEPLPDPAPVEEPEPEYTPESVPEASETVTPPPSVPESASTPSVPKKTPEPPFTPSVPKKTPEPPSTPPVPDLPSTPSVPEPADTTTTDPVTSEPTPPAPEIKVGGQRVYLCLRGNSVTSTLLDALDRHNIRATVFCDETFLSERGDLLRRMAVTGHRIGLYVASGPPMSVLERLETCNLLLRRTTMEKTRFVFVDGAGEELRRTVYNAGFLCLRPTLSHTETPLRTSRQAKAFLNQLSGQPETLSVWIDGDVTRSGLNTFVSEALDIEDTFLPWTETAS